jgi:hypothetical protein
MEDFTHPPYKLQKYIVVPLKTPIFGNNFAIRDKWIELAIKTKKLLLIRTPFGQEIISPKVYKKESTVFSKEYLIPGVPMKMYQRNLKLKPLEDIEKYSVDW